MGIRYYGYGPRLGIRLRPGVTEISRTGESNDRYHARRDVGVNELRETEAQRSRAMGDNASGNRSRRQPIESLIRRWGCKRHNGKCCDYGRNGSSYRGTGIYVGKHEREY